MNTSQHRLPRGLGSPGGKAGLYYGAVGNSTGSTVGANQLRVHLVWLPRPIDRLSCKVSVAGAAGDLVRMGAYRNVGGYPADLLVDGGTVGIDSTGRKDVTVALAEVGWVWLGAVLQNVTGTPQMEILDKGIPHVGLVDPAVSSQFNAFKQDSVSAGLPATFTATAAGEFAVRVWGRAT